MAQRRMFSPDIVCSDAFLDMSVSARELYFQLGMAADDDGFVNPKRIMRNVGASDDDLKILLLKRFLLSFGDGVVVIKHWLIHNLIRIDRYHPTMYLEHKKKLIIKENKAYSEMATNGLQNDNHLATEVRLGKDRLVLVETKVSTEQIKEVKNSDDESERSSKPNRRVKDKEAVFFLFGKQQPWWHHKNQREAALRLFDRGIDKLKRGIFIMNENKSDQFCPQALTPFEYESKLPKINAYIKKHGL